MAITYRHIIAVTLTIIVAVLFYLHRNISDESHYVGSDNCQQCHQTHHLSWSQTLHPKQYRLVQGPEDIQGDFSSDNPALTFKLEDVDSVIGNKWEQVYAQKIGDEYYPLPAKWLIPKQEWVAYKVNSWRETPLSTKCNGCHTTGFNPDTFEFSEYGVGCEACHGSGSQHVQRWSMANDQWCNVCHQENVEEQSDDIIVSVKSSVCGQCHSRGKQRLKSAGREHIQTTFNFPIGYKPGEDISSDFKPSTAASDKKKKNWWQPDLSKNRHQEYADFTKSKHAKSLINLKEHPKGVEGELTAECLRCHSADYRLAAADKKPGLQEAKHGITCVVCHEPHGMDRLFAIGEGGPNICGNCHIDTLSASTSKKGKAHYPCPSGKVLCADCHMPRIVKSGGVFPIRSHAFKIVSPSASKKSDMPNSCQNGGCHQDRDLEWAIQAYRDHYGADE